MKKNITLYCDKGAGAFSVLSVKRYFKHDNITLVSSDDVIRHGIPSSMDLFIMPGGADIPYTQKLNGKGNEAIRRYVENGGTYLGICAGAYYGSKDIEFQKGTPEEICGPRELGFFKGTAIGCLTAIAQPYDTSLKSAAITAINKDGKSPHVLYWGGCTFNVQDNHNIDVLATYEDIAYEGIKGAPPAIIACSVGQGRAILSGVHFEVTPETLMDYSFDTDSDNDLKQGLAQKLDYNTPMSFEHLIRKT